MSTDWTINGQWLAVYWKVIGRAGRFKSIRLLSSCCSHGFSFKRQEAARSASLFSSGGDGTEQAYPTPPTTQRFSPTICLHCRDNDQLDRSSTVRSLRRYCIYALKTKTAGPAHCGERSPYPPPNDEWYNGVQWRNHAATLILTNCGRRPARDCRCLPGCRPSRKGVRFVGMGSLRRGKGGWLDVASWKPAGPFRFESRYLRGFNEMAVTAPLRPPGGKPRSRGKPLSDRPRQPSCTLSAP